MVSREAAEVMSLAQSGRVETALELAHAALERCATASPFEQAGLWYAIAVAHHSDGDCTAQATAADRCLDLARQMDSPGWAANALTLRAMALIRQHTMEPALLDLARAEMELAATDDPGLASWGHTGLGYCYLEMRLYELALPHLEEAAGYYENPLPLPEARLIDLMNLAELHQRWADDLERSDPYEAASKEADQHRADAHVHALAAVEEAEHTGSSLLDTCRAMELCSRARGSLEASIDELAAAFRTPGDQVDPGGRAAVGASLSRALWRLDRREEALTVAREAADLATDAGDWQVSAGAMAVLVEMEYQAGLEGATAGHDYAQMLSRVLWQQRLSTLQGARAALSVERLNHERNTARRESREDPLTGVGNRRALDDALRAASRSKGREDPTSMLVIDLDEFKAVNDRFGHVVGDSVLREVARAIRSTARSDDTVARLGGDEFVVVAQGTDRVAGHRLADRVTQAIEELELDLGGEVVQLGVSVGVQTTGAGLGVADLLAAADAAMYDVKRGDELSSAGEPA